jgi:hypothetical protein
LNPSTTRCAGGPPPRCSAIGRSEARPSSSSLSSRSGDGEGDHLPQANGGGVKARPASARGRSPHARRGGRRGG